MDEHHEDSNDNATIEYGEEGIYATEEMYDMFLKVYRNLRQTEYFFKKVPMWLISLNHI